MDLGMSMAVANQMVATMNNAINSMHTPGQTYVGPTLQNPPAAPAQKAEFYALIGEKVAGPLSEANLTALAAGGKLGKETMVWRPGLDEWKRAEDIPEVYKLILLNA